MIKVLFASSEIYPFAKTGGLADVSDAFPFALKNRVDISRITPLYSFMQKKSLKPYESFVLVVGETDYEIEIFTQTDNGLVTYFVEAPFLSTTPHLYGDATGDYPNNDLRFGLFCRAIVELSLRLGIEVLHLNDWHTALSALFIKEFNLNIKTIFTIHNLAYHGVFTYSTLSNLSIDSKHYNFEGLEFYDRVNFLKAGITYSDLITTVSPSYAQEILTPEFGCGLDAHLRHHQKKLSGILNGINYNTFNPQSGLDFPYDNNTLENKHKNKVAFIKQSTLKDPRIPLFVMVSRLVQQKGLDLLLESLEEFLQKRVNLFILGEGNAEICEKLQTVAQKHENFEFLQGYDESLSHKIYAVADFLLMPSRFEPCGLNQFIAMHYGTIPIVHAVGGLKDSVHEQTKECGKGIVFENQTKEDFLLAIQRALEFKKESKKFKATIEFNMECDFSFTHGSLEYLKLYESLV